MSIQECLLDVGNGIVVAGSTVGDRIRQTGKQHLWDERPGLIDTVVIHYISAVNLKPDDPYELPAILGIFCDFGVSSHYLIDRAGQVCCLVPEEHRAWHCGPSLMPEPDSRTAVNAFSIGVELVATADSGFTDEQYDALVGLCLDIELRRGRMSYVGHDAIAGERAVALGLRPEAKVDPGPLFDWGRLIRALRPVA